MSLADKDIIDGVECKKQLRITNEELVLVEVKTSMGRRPISRERERKGRPRDYYVCMSVVIMG